jgi:hypothetical protein
MSLLLLSPSWPPFWPGAPIWPGGILEPLVMDVAWGLLVGFLVLLGVLSLYALAEWLVKKPRK